ncbi:phosphatidylinositol transfer protein, partial [Striga asiatica]
MYMVMKMQQQNTTGSEGVEVLENRSFEDDDYGKGQYTLKIYRFQSKAPSWLARFAPTGALVMQEEAWNAYPRFIKCPYFTRFILTIETIHKADRGLSENVHGLSKEQLAVRQIEMLDIVSSTSDYWSYVIGTSGFDFSQFKSDQTARGPLLDGWQHSIIVIRMSSLQGERALFIESHRNCFGWIDEWFGLTLDTLRELEKQSDSSLNQPSGPGLNHPCMAIGFIVIELPIVPKSGTSNHVHQNQDNRDHHINNRDFSPAFLKAGHDPSLARPAFVAELLLLVAPSQAVWVGPSGPDFLGPERFVYIRVAARCWGLAASGLQV